MSHDRYDERRATMVATQIAARGVTDPAVLAAMRTVPREAFVPRSWLSVRTTTTCLCPLGKARPSPSPISSR